jgi:transcriptional regulator with XRE-family HTH domain
MNTAKQIRERRAELSLSAVTLAEALGISVEAYDDLEQHQDELATSVTLEQATRLATRLGTPLLELLTEHKPPWATPSPIQVAARIATHLAGTGRSLESLEEVAGWELQGFLAQPLLVARGQPIMFFQDLAKALQAAPFSLIPHLHVA